VARSTVASTTWPFSLVVRTGRVCSRIFHAAAAAAACLWEPKARRLVERLAEAHLIEPGDRYGWWRMHDLVRLYATDLAEHCAAADHRDRAQDWLLGY
jgi:hypothetical protein